MVQIDIFDIINIYMFNYFVNVSVNSMKLNQHESLYKMLLAGTITGVYLYNSQKKRY